MQKFTPIEYMYIDISNQFGNDKMQFSERIQWVKDNEPILEDYIDTADDKYRYISAVMALRTVQAGKPTGHLVGLDAASSGPQLMAILMRDAVGARNTCAIGSDRNDVYGITTDAMNRMLGTNKVYDRDTIKYVLMPFMYGSQLKPKMVFGEGTDECKAFYQAQAEVVPGAAYLMPILRASWNAFAPEHSWVLPDGFVARVKVTTVKETKIEVDEFDHSTFKYQYCVVEGKESGVANIANATQSIDGYLVRELTRRCSYDWVQMSRVASLLHRRLSLPYVGSPTGQWEAQQVMSIAGYENMSWNDIGSMTHSHANELLKIVNRCLSRPSFHVVSCHDEFMAHPNYMNYVRQTYVELLAELSDGRLIDDILSYLYREPVRIDKMSNSVSKQILESEYAIS